MKINPVSFVINQTNHSVITNKNIDKLSQNEVNSINYGKNFVTSNILFKAGYSSKVPEIVRNSAIQDKLAIGFNRMDNNDFMILCKTRKTGAEMLQKCADLIDFPIQKLIFVTVPNIKSVLAFRKYENKNIVYNIGKTNILLNDKTLIMSEEYYKLPKKSLIQMEDGIIDFSKQTDAENLEKLEDEAKYFIKGYDFSGLLDNNISAYNSNISAIISVAEAQKTAKQTKADPKTKLDFSNIGGQNHIVDSIKRNILFPIQYPDAFNKFQQHQQNKGFIFSGPPGTGKSLMAEIICDMSGATCFKIAGSELDSKYIGESEERWRNLHEKAVAHQPSIIFIDEIDATAKNRMGHDADKVVNQILALMSDDEKQNRQIYWIGATNKYELLDSAITRSGRFGKNFEFLPPQTEENVEQIFNIHAKSLPLDSEIDKKTIISSMLRNKMTGADIKMIVDDARTKAFERNNIFNSMDNGTYSPDMLENLTVSTDDFISSIKDFETKSNIRKQISFPQ